MMASTSTRTGTPAAALPAVRRVVVRQTELVRGKEEEIMREIAAILRMESVELDLAQVQRIDAAGIAALVSLYAMARDLGRTLKIAEMSRHVKEILVLVRLEPLFISHNVSVSPQSGPDGKIVVA